MAAFETDFNNYTANFTDVVAGGFVNRLVNAGKVSTKGVEGDITYRPISDLRLALAFADDDARVDHFNCPPGSPVSCNIDGQPLPFAPRRKLHGEIGYTIPASTSFDLDFESTYDWQSAVQYSLSETPDTVQPAFGIWNASVGLIGTKGGWQVRALGNNLLDRSYSEALAPGSLGGIVRFVPRNDHRYFGINISKAF